MYSILPYTFARAKEIGVTVEPSTSRNKKIDVYDANGNFLCAIGDIRYLDFPYYVQTRGLEYGNERRELYHKRHKNEGLRGKLSAILLW